LQAVVAVVMAPAQEAVVVLVVIEQVLQHLHYHNH
jgi:hypothetical protein